MYFHDLQFQNTECMRGPNRPQMRPCLVSFWCMLGVGVGVLKKNIPYWFIEVQTQCSMSLNMESVVCKNSQLSTKNFSWIKGQPMRCGIMRACHLTILGIHVCNQGPWCFGSSFLKLQQTENVLRKTWWLSMLWMKWEFNWQRLHHLLDVGTSLHRQ